jgi:pimeloyl-ACP methyl ester carboxylesterase
MTLRRLPSTPVPMHLWASRDGITLAGDSWGPTDGRPVILLHGGGQTRHAWKQTGSTLGALGYYAITFDARGHGDTDWDPAGDYSQDTRVNDLCDVAAANGMLEPILIGASMGGVTSIIAVGESRLRASALVLVDIAPRVEPSGVSRIRQFMNQRPDGFGTLQEVADAIQAYQPHRQVPDSLDGLAKNVRIGDNGRYYWHWDPKTRRQEMSPTERQTRLERCTRQLRLPVMLIRGQLSDVLSERGAEEFLRMCPGSEYANIAGTAHMVAGDRNDVFTSVITDFLARNIIPPVRLSDHRYSIWPEERRDDSSPAMPPSYTGVGTVPCVR